MLSLLSNLFGAIMKGLGLAKQRNSEENTPAMQANAAAQTQADVAAQVAKDDAAAAKGDLSQAERDAAP
jgi:hypothetical protein